MLVMEKWCMFWVWRCAEGTFVGLCDYEALAMVDRDLGGAVVRSAWAI